MDALSTVVEVFSVFGEVLNRSDEKDQELSTLAATVQSISQSMRVFAEGLAPEEREDVFSSNKVFSKLVEQIQQCHEVINKHRGANGFAQPERIEDGEPHRSVLGALRRGLSHGSAMAKESLEVFRSRLGDLGSGLLRLPEDELAKIRQAATELTGLVPQLNLAISVYSMRGQKRSADGWLNAAADRSAKVPCLEGVAGPDAAGGLARGGSLTDAGNAAGNGSGGSRRGSHVSQISENVPRLVLQLVSDSPLARTLGELPHLTTQDLRPVSAASTSSLDSLQQGNEGTCRLVFGRQELRDKVPKTFTLPTKTGELSQPPQPISRFVSRDLFLIDVPLPQPAEVVDSLEMCTLAFGGATEDGGETLAWGVGASVAERPAEDPPLAVVTALSPGGLHIRAPGETRWQWKAKDIKVHVHEGHCFALLLDSPPGSITPGPPRDLESKEALLLLGLELRRPKE